MKSISSHNSRKNSYNPKLDYELDNIYRNINVLSYSIIENYAKLRNEIIKLDASLKMLEDKYTNLEIRMEVINARESNKQK